MPRKRKKWLWADAFLPAFNLPAGGRTVVDLTSPIRAVVPSIANYTVTGVFGEVNLSSSGASQLSTVVHAMTVVNEQAFNIGGTACPNPATDFAPWLYFMSTGFRGRTAAADGGLTIPISVQSKRRLDETDQRLVWLVNNYSGLDTITVQFWFRFLIDQR